MAPSRKWCKWPVKTSKKLLHPWLPSRKLDHCNLYLFDVPVDREILQVYLALWFTFSPSSSWSGKYIAWVCIVNVCFSSRASIRPYPLYVTLGYQWKEMLGFLEKHHLQSNPKKVLRQDGFGSGRAAWIRTKYLQIMRFYPTFVRIVRRAMKIY